MRMQRRQSRLSQPGEAKRKETKGGIQGGRERDLWLSCSKQAREGTRMLPRQIEQHCNSHLEQRPHPLHCQPVKAGDRRDSEQSTGRWIHSKASRGVEGADGIDEHVFGVEFSIAHLSQHTSRQSLSRGSALLFSPQRPDCIFLRLTRFSNDRQRTENTTG